MAIKVYSNRYKIWLKRFVAVGIIIGIIYGATIVFNIAKNFSASSKALTFKEEYWRLSADSIYRIWDKNNYLIAVTSRGIFVTDQVLNILQGVTLKRHICCAIIDEITDKVAVLTSENNTEYVLAIFTADKRGINKIAELNLGTAVNSQVGLWQRNDKGVVIIGNNITFYKVENNDIKIVRTYFHTTTVDGYRLGSYGAGEPAIDIFDGKKILLLTYSNKKKVIGGYEQWLYIKSRWRLAGNTLYKYGLDGKEYKIVDNLPIGKQQHPSLAYSNRYAIIYNMPYYYPDKVEYYYIIVDVKERHKYHLFKLNVPVHHITQNPEDSQQGKFYFVTASGLFYFANNKLYGLAPIVSSQQIALNASITVIAPFIIPPGKFYTTQKADAVAIGVDNNIYDVSIYPGDAYKRILIGKYNIENNQYQRHFVAIPSIVNTVTNIYVPSPYYMFVILRNEIVRNPVMIDLRFPIEGQGILLESNAIFDADKQFAAVVSPQGNQIKIYKIQKHGMPKEVFVIDKYKETFGNVYYIKIYVLDENSLDLYIQSPQRSYLVYINTVLQKTQAWVWNDASWIYDKRSNAIKLPLLLDRRGHRIIYAITNTKGKIISKVIRKNVKVNEPISFAYLIDNALVTNTSVYPFEGKNKGTRIIVVTSDQEGEQVSFIRDIGPNYVVVEYNCCGQHTLNLIRIINSEKIIIDARIELDKGDKVLKIENGKVVIKTRAGVVSVYKEEERK